MAKIAAFSKQFDEFVNYCISFYSVEQKNAIYPFATDSEIMDACMAHMTNPNPKLEFENDSYDRERVQDIIFNKRTLN